MARLKTNAKTEKEDMEFERGRKLFYKTFPDCPKPKEIERLNLIMKLDHAIDILTGEKRWEWRKASEYYFRRLFSQEVYEYAEKHKDDEKFQELYPYALTMNDVVTIHFHDYNNEWFLDVECTGTYDVFATEENAQFFREELNCHDLDDEAAWCAAYCEEGEETEFYAMELGEVLDTNLDDLPEDRKKKK